MLASYTGRKVIRKFHTDRKVKIPLDQGETKSVKIRTGVRQECCLAPILLDLQSEFLTNEALEVCTFQNKRTSNSHYETHKLVAQGRNGATRHDS